MTARRVIERLSTTLSPLAPEGATPDALEIDQSRKLLYVANADNNSIGVIRISNPTHSEVLGFTELINRMQTMSQAEIAGQVPLERAQRANGAQTCSVNDV